jgi:DNA-binding NtrC family response regulator
MELKVLVVDDEKVTLELLEHILCGAGCQVETAEKGSEALERIQGNDYDLIISDIRMPGIGGIEVLKYAKAKNPECLVVLCTGYATMENAIEAIKAGAYDYITKPFTVDEVLVVLRNAWERTSLARNNGRLLDKLGEIYLELKMSRPSAEGVKDSQPPAAGSQPVIYDGRIVRGTAEPLKIEPGSGDAVTEINALAKLRKDGYITAEEFEKFKGMILGKIC